MIRQELNPETCRLDLTSMLRIQNNVSAIVSQNDPKFIGDMISAKIGQKNHNTVGDMVSAKI